MGKIKIGAATAGILFFIFCSQVAFAYSTPDPAKTFYGDANGDQQLQSDDLPLHRLQVYLGYPAYNTPQLNNVDDRWNTCDVTGDQKCQTDDMTPIKAAVYLNPLPKNWNSWEIVNVSFQPSANIGETKSFQIRPHAVSGGVPNARPGIVVKLTVAPDSPVQDVTLGGRVCPTPDAKCSVSVGITQWQISTALAPTETSADGFSFTANEAGTLILVAEFTAQATMKIAATSVRLNASIASPNAIDVSCADTNETDPISCEVLTATGADNCAIGPNDTCGGSIDSACVGPYTAPAQGEAAGPGTCVAEVVKGEAVDTNVVNIDEINRIPYFTSTAPTSVKVTVGGSYSGINGIAADADLPKTGASDPGYLTCAAQNRTCSFAVNVSGSGAGMVSCAMSFTSGAAQEICSVDVKVTDGYGASLTKNILINSANIWFVDIDAPAGGNGLSWATAFNQPQAAVNAASSGDMVWVVEGTYYRSPRSGTGSILTMKNGVDIYGGFVGTELDLSQRPDPSLHPTILDGETASLHVIVGASNASLDGLKIINGKGTSGYSGAGMYNIGVQNLDIASCIFANNATVGQEVGGSGIYFEDPVGVYITDSTFSGNTGKFAGAAIGLYKNSTSIISDTQVANCSFSGNGLRSTYSGSAYGYGGALSSVIDNLQISNCIFSNNYVYVNELYAPYAWGGHLYGTGFGGAVAIGGDGFARISNSVFKFNSASNSGGAVVIDGATVELANCTFYGNRAIISQFSISRAYGGAIAASGTLNITVKNCILWDDSAETGGSEIALLSNYGPTSLSISYSDVDGGQASTFIDTGLTLNWGTGMINLNPLFISTTTTNFHLQTSSPCRNTGDPDPIYNDPDGTRNDQGVYGGPGAQ